MKILTKVLSEIYILIFRLSAKVKKGFMIHILGFFAFLSSSLKHKQRGNKEMARRYLKLAPLQLLYAIKRFPN